ncbi:Transmembrane protein 43 [Blattella germanica]|nr:Transmembrane protein 43 [Blattella germanica]
MYRTNFPEAPRPYTNSFQRRRNGSIKEQLKSSWLTAIIGCAMLSTGMWLLFWNEGQAVQTARSLEEAMNAVIAIQYTTVVMEENNGKLVHFSGPLHIGEPLAEPEYGVSVPAVKLKRRVQIEFPLKSTVYISEHVSVGGFIFGSALKNKFTDFILVTSDERPERKDIKLHAGLYYHSQDVWNPDIGDIRVQFSYAGKAGEVVSVVGMQAGNKIQPYKTFSGDEILMLRNGRLSVEEMFLEEKARNQLLTWTYRVSRYSILHDLLVLGTSSINMAVSSSLCLLVMSFAWIWYRPMLGALLIVGSFVPIVISAFRLYRGDHQENRYQRL